LFDLGFSGPNQLVRAQDAARRFLKESVLPRDLVGVGTIDVDRGFRLLSAFTTDRELVASAINDPTRFKGTDPLQIANQTVSFNVNSDAATSPNARGNKEAADSEQLEMSKRQQHNNEAYARQRV